MYDNEAKELFRAIKYEHDVVYSQKYADILPYSQHLEWVHTKAVQFHHLLKNKGFNAGAGYTESTISVVAYGHDLLEDTNMTFNDLKDFLRRHKMGRWEIDVVAETIYNLTDEKGRNRAERKNDKYYRELSRNPLAIYIKLCDIAVNTLFSKLQGSKMYDKYKKEFPHFKEKVYMEEFAELFDYVESI